MANTLRERKTTREIFFPLPNSTKNNLHNLIIPCLKKNFSLEIQLFFFFFFCCLRQISVFTFFFCVVDKKLAYLMEFSCDIFSNRVTRYHKSTPMNIIQQTSPIIPWETLLFFNNKIFFFFLLSLLAFVSHFFLSFLFSFWCSIF